MLVRSIVLPAGERGGGCSSWKSRCYWIGGSSCALVRVISATKGNEVDRASGIFRPAMAQYLSELDSLAFGRLAQRERRCLTSTRSGVQIPHRPPDFQARALSWPFCFLLRFGDDGGSGAWLAFEGGRYQSGRCYHSRGCAAVIFDVFTTFLRPDWQNRRCYHSLGGVLPNPTFFTTPTGPSFVRNGVRCPMDGTPWSTWGRSGPLRSGNTVRFAIRRAKKW